MRLHILSTLWQNCGGGFAEFQGRRASSADSAYSHSLPERRAIHARKYTKTPPAWGRRFCASVDIDSGIAQQQLRLVETRAFHHMQHGGNARLNFRLRAEQAGICEFCTGEIQ